MRYVIQRVDKRGPFDTRAGSDDLEQAISSAKILAKAHPGDSVEVADTHDGSQVWSS